MRRTVRPTSKSALIREVYRSKLEERIAAHLEALGVNYRYEKRKVEYTVPARSTRYTPDFELDNGILIEGKGLFEAKDRQKHLLIKDQHPELDIRFVFQNSNQKLYKGSPTSYAEWCRKHGFKFADKLVPIEWIKEKPCVH
jgi:hypothetical protein